MLVKLIRADNCIEYVETNSYIIGPVKDWDKIIAEIYLYSNNGKLLHHEARKHKKEYIKDYVPEKIELKPAHT